MAGQSDSFQDLRLDEMAAAALEAAGLAGCDSASVRVEQTRSQLLTLRDGRVETSLDETSLGASCRVVEEGSFGFAATVELGADAGAGLARRAVATARATSQALRRRVELAPEEPHGRVEWVSSYEIDPVDVPLQEKVELLGTWSDRLLASPEVDHVTASVRAVVEDKYYADLAGTTAIQRRVRIHPTVEILSVDPQTGEFETMRTLAPPAGRGWEYLVGTGWDFEIELAELPGHLAEKRQALSVEAGHYDLVIDPSNLWLTIHESIGHATELDRAMGYEAAMAGTSFATFDKLGSLRYGSEVMNIRADRTVEHGLSTIAIDDEGVEGQSFDLVIDGVLRGYQLDRRIAAEMGFSRSNGCAYAESALQTPIQRMANVSLQPARDEVTLQDLIGAVESGIYVVGDKSWSIDMQRHNFQFTGQRFFSIENGRLTGQLKDVAYQARTTDFWGSMEAVGGSSTYVLGGAFNCGKGQPMQSAPVSHGCPAALFRQVNVLNTKAESGR